MKKGNIGMGMLEELEKLHSSMKKAAMEKKIKESVSQISDEKYYSETISGFTDFLSSDVVETARKKIISAYNERMKILQEITKLKRGKRAFFSCGCLSIGVFLIAALVSYLAENFYAVPVVLFIVLALANIVGIIFSSKIKGLQEELLEKYATIDLGSIPEDLNSKFGEVAKAWTNINASDIIYQVLSENEIEDRVRERTSAATSIERKKMSKEPFTDLFVNAACSPIIFKSAGNGFIFMYPGLVVMAYDNPNFELDRIRVGSWSESSLFWKSQRFIETDAVPKDAKIIDYTFKYANLDGSRDLRYKDNEMIPVVKYNEVTISVANNSMTYHISNESLVQQFFEKTKVLVE